MITRTASQTIERRATVPEQAAGQRLDAAVADLFPEFSRSRLQRWLKTGALTVDGASPRGRTAVRGGEVVVIAAELEDEGHVEPQAIPLDIIHEDADILIINKPAGLVVHPGAGNPAGTLQNALLHHARDLGAVPRAGIVHRLDRETTGLMVVAKTLEAHTHLVEQLQARTVGREYLALVAGTFTAGGSVDAPIGRHPRDRLRMAVRSDGPGTRPAVTHYRIEERFPAHTLLRCRLETGRTHQIRVHMAYRRHPILGDPLYGGRLALPRQADQIVWPPAVDDGAASRSVADWLRGCRRQMLHAETLTLVHPARDETMSWSAPAPADFAAVLAALRAYREAMDTHDQDAGRWRP